MDSRARRTTIIAASVAPLLLLAGCATGPTDADRAGWQEWFQGISAAAGGTSAAGMLSTSDDPAEGVTADFAAPGHYTSVELRCIGADRAQFSLTYRTASGETSVTQEIVCHGGAPLTPIAIPTGAQDLVSFTARASSPDGAGAWVAIPQH
ncbi:hypothetical protein [Microbacterium dextranolyticum]|uniref:Lipoprotein n=1 Tax=Microbacterium dextranolyticum TaxID=36806 RepID=A0A9W6M5I2_9MICO|nr:hypothetical protein [Microbacterium dextranolyticum]MBM7463779.1 hypothetical protein [Microbacterium dextranolyticum]GLJ94861.1 hypothetical protein GCM10017591_09230 [Microbacterium dextranolyticum]